MRGYDIGLTIYALRKSKGLSQSELADNAEVSQDYISYIELGKRNPSIKTLKQIVSALNLSSLSSFFIASEKIAASNDIKLIKELAELENTQLFKEIVSEITKN